MKKVAVTGGSGKAGRAVVRELLDHNYEVRNIDRAVPVERICSFIKADLTDAGEAIEALAGCDAVIHLAAIPAPGILTDEKTFRINTTSTYNVFSAARLHKMKRIAWASSETTLGLPFNDVKPKFAPIDETHYPFPQSSYALSKVVGETMADQFARWTGIPIVSLRLSNVMEVQDYTRFRSMWADPNARRWNAWGYIDARDAAQAFRLGIERPIDGHEAFIIAAADTVMDRPSRELLQAVYSETPLRREIGTFETLLSIDKARRMLGYEPIHSWRNKGEIVI